jgi:AraC family transcriptional regulator
VEFIYLRSQDNRSLKGYASAAYHVPTHRLIRIVSGEGLYKFPDKELPVGPGDIFLTVPGVRTLEYVGEQNIHIQVINFSAPEYWMDAIYVKYNGRDRQYQFLCEIFNDLICGSEKRKNTLLNLAIDLFVEDGELKDGGNKVIQDITKYIEENPHLVIPVADLAGRAGCSESHFRAIFRKEMKISPKAYIKKTKMDYAIRLMRDENMQVKQVAHILGYNDIYEFSKQFKTVFGKPPTQLVKRKPARL